MVEFISKVYKTKIGMSLLIKTVVIGVIFLIDFVIMIDRADKRVEVEL